MSTSCDAAGAERAVQPDTSDRDVPNAEPEDHVDRGPGLAEAPAIFVGHPRITSQSVADVLLPPPPLRVRLHRVGGADLIVPDVAALPRPLRDKAVKRWLDVLLAAAALAFLALPMLLIAAVLRLQGGSAFFVQPRVGKDRSRFPCFKLRTMRPDAEARLQRMLAADAAARDEWRRHQKLCADPRVTRLGRWLRAYSIDELPQLINVLRGEMSLVGPRPIVAPEVPGYPSDRAYFESEAFTDYAGCVPGITGLWQIAGRHKTAHAERVRLDRWYARNWSVVLDLMIMLRTVRVVLRRSGD